MLFDPKDLVREPTDDQTGPEQVAGIAVAGAVRHALGRKQASLSDSIGDLRQNEHVHVPSMSSWSMHDVLAYILQRTGPADVWITSWTITEEPVRTLLALMDSGAIRSLRAVFSERVEAMNPSAHQLARFNLQVRLAKIHAKCIVVLNDTWGVTVGGSANFTRNPRIEKYIVCTHREVAIHERAWIDDVLAGGDPFTPNG